MIRSFKNKALKALFDDGVKKGIRPDHRQKLLDILDQLNAATAVQDMNFPGSGLHELKGSLKGYWAVRISGNWRLIFEFEAGHAYSVDYLDYH